MRAIWVLALSALIGCERAQTAGPASQPAGKAQQSAARIEPATPATAPSEPVPAIVRVDQKNITFPPAIVQFRNHDGQLTAILMSDDPKSAIDDNYHGNSFYLEMPLEVTDLKDVPASVYRFNSPSSERTDSPNGIFLDGNRVQLQPADIQVQFDGDKSAMSVVVSGQFLQFDTRDDTIAPKRVAVISKLDAQVKQKAR